MKRDRTKCAPPDRLGAEEVRKQHAALSQHVCSGYFDFFPLPLLVINAQRQIVFSNATFRKMLGAGGYEDFASCRPGEAMGCIYSDQESAGCGTAEHCRECGALRAVMESITKNAPSEHECQLLLDAPGGVGARDLRVFVSPWEVGGENYYVVTISDIEDEKRRRVLERLFFHDILNSAGSARSLAEILKDEISGQAHETAELIETALFSLVDEIQKQKELLALESGEYRMSPLTLQGREVLESIANEYSKHKVAMEKNIVVDPESDSPAVHTDYTLFRRVLVNMVINALEATYPGGTVRLGVDAKRDTAVFWVHNDAVMPEKVRLQVFKRSYSTKGEGRGLGTYSIKLLTENYLGGEVGFSSSEKDGTTFWLEICIRPYCEIAE